MQPVVQMRDEWTVADLDTLDVEDWWRYEIVDGALVVSPPAGRKHEFVSAYLRAIVWDALPEGGIVIGPAGVAFGRSFRVPDLVVVDRATLDAGEDGPFAPADVLLAVEIVSPGSVTTDRVTKPAQYAAAGIRHFWRVETRPVSLTAYALDGEAYRELGSWGAGETARLSEPFGVEVAIDGLS